MFPALGRPLPPVFAWRRPAVWLSVCVLVLALFALVVPGLSLGLDFTGGSVLELRFRESIPADTLREYLSHAGFSAVSIQALGGGGHEYLLRLPATLAEDGVASLPAQRLIAQLQVGWSGVDVLRLDVLGPQFGAELALRGLLAFGLVLLGVFAYVGFRFEHRFAIGAVAALIFDVLITLGAMAAFRVPLDLITLAALLAMIGYSLNDSLVIFDRVREQLRTQRRQTTVNCVTEAVQATLARTLITSGTTLLVVIALLLFGGQALRGFSVVLLVGLLSGTWSSVYIATVLVLRLGLRSEDLQPPATDAV